MLSGSKKLARTRLGSRFAIPAGAGLAASIALAGSAFAASAQSGSDAARSLLAANIDPAGAPGCHRATEIAPVLFAGREITAYDFTAETAVKLNGVMAAMAEQAVPDAALIKVVLLPDTDRALAFLFGRDGCRTVTLDLDVRSMEAVFATAGVTAPFDPKLAKLNGVEI